MRNGFPRKLVVTHSLEYHGVTEKLKPRGTKRNTYKRVHQHDFQSEQLILNYSIEKKRKANTSFEKFDRSAPAFSGTLTQGHRGSPFRSRRRQRRVRCEAATGATGSKVQTNSNCQRPPFSRARSNVGKHFRGFKWVRSRGLGREPFQALFGESKYETTDLSNAEYR